jgi:hypothetical protein
LDKPWVVTSPVQKLCAGGDVGQINPHIVT